MRTESSLERVYKLFFLSKSLCGRYMHTCRSGVLQLKHRVDYHLIADVYHHHSEFAHELLET